MNPELQALQQAIQGLHQLMVVLKDPNDTAIVSQCLTALTKVQKDMMVNRSSDARSAVQTQLGGGGGGGYQ